MFELMFQGEINCIMTCLRDSNYTLAETKCQELLDIVTKERHLYEEYIETVFMEQLGSGLLLQYSPRGGEYDSSF